MDGTFRYSQEQLDLGMETTMIHALLESNLTPFEKSHARLWQEGQVTIGAGTATPNSTHRFFEQHVPYHQHWLMELYYLCWLQHTAVLCCILLIPELSPALLSACNKSEIKSVVVVPTNTAVQGAPPQSLYK
jgi:hypothetical protein